MGPPCAGQRGMLGGAWEPPGSNLSSFTNHIGGVSPNFLFCKTAVLKHTLPALACTMSILASTKEVLKNTDSSFPSSLLCSVSSCATCNVLADGLFTASSTWGMILHLSFNSGQTRWSTAVPAGAGVLMLQGNASLLSRSSGENHSPSDLFWPFLCLPWCSLAPLQAASWVGNA